MSNEIKMSETVDVPVNTAFEYVNDYQNVASWFYGISKFVPKTSQTSGLGATFDASIHLGVTLHTTIECIEWEQDKLIALDSTKGFKNTTRWLFEDDGNGGTRITADVNYKLPFGPAGKALGKVIEPVIKIAVHHTTEHLVKNLTALKA
jgi:uncharacterized membrane protein